MSSPEESLPHPSDAASSSPVPQPKVTPIGGRKGLLEGADVSAEPKKGQQRTLVTGAPTYNEKKTVKKIPEAEEGGGGGWMPAFVMTLIFSGVLGTAGFLTYKWKIEPKLAGGAPAASSSTNSGNKNGAELDVMRGQLSVADTKILELQKQLDAQRAEKEVTQKQIQEMTDRMALVIKRNTFVPSADTTRATDADASQVAAILPTVTPSTSELVLLKERNRLMSYADEAIATGKREPLMSLVNSMTDPALRNLHHAALAEYKRVQTHFEFSVSIDPSYTLPIREMFKNPDIRSEADLSPEQLMTIAKDLKAPWEARLRSIFLLRSSKASEVDALLLKMMKEDPSLDVAKQAQTIFENRVGRRFRIFDLPAIEAWQDAQSGGSSSKAEKAAGVKMVEPSAEPELPKEEPNKTKK